MPLPVKVIVLFFVAAVSGGQLLADYSTDAFAALDKKQFASAIRLFTLVIKYNQDDVAAFWGRAGAYHALGEFDKAIEDYNEANRLEPTNVWVLISRGSTWFDKGDLEKALADYGEAIQLDPNGAILYKTKDKVLECMRRIKRGSEGG